MSQPTATRKLRTLDWDKDKPYFVRRSIMIPGRLRPNGSIQRQARFKWALIALKGDMVRRDEYKPAEERKDLGKCAYCSVHVYASQGQIILMAVNGKGDKSPTHKHCRKIHTNWRAKPQRIYSAKLS